MTRERGFRPAVRGRVKWYSDALGHGFVIPEGGGEDALIDRTGIADGGPVRLEKGAEVTYELVWDGEGARAENVREA